MELYRTIQPLPPPQQQDRQRGRLQQATAAEEVDLEGPLQSKRKTRQRHTEEEWEAIRPDLTELLLCHGLVDAIERIKQTHNFEAGIRAYRSRIADWGLKQNQDAENLGIVVAKREKRKREENKETTVIARGEQLATERLDLFQRRTKHKQSPSAATPQSIEYYTPANNGRTPDTIQTPLGLRRALLHPGLPNAAPEHTEQRDFCKRLLILDQTTQPVVVLRPLKPKSIETLAEHEIGSETTTGQTPPSLTDLLDTVSLQMAPGARIEALKTKSQLPQRPVHDLHQGGQVAIAGRGRFAKKEKPLKLLWQMKQLWHDLGKTLSHSNPSAKAGLPGAPSATADRISYVVRMRGNGTDMGEKRQCLVRFCQQNSRIHSVLGLSKQDRMRWLQHWHETDEDDASLIVQTANHLFGDVTSSYPETDILEVLVYLHTTAPRREPVLLRAAAGWDLREEHNKCLYCDDRLLIVDFMGPGGAVKLHHSAINSAGECGPLSTFDSFRNTFTDARKTVYPSWSEIGYLFQGWFYAPLLRRCPCESKTHKHLGSEHYLNVFDEQAAQLEDFDPTASSYARVPFEPFPSEEEDRIVFLYGREGSRVVSEEGWDPSGDEGSEDEFDPYPEAEHDSVSDIKAVKINARVEMILGRL